MQSTVNSHWIDRLAGPVATLRSPEPFVLAGLEWLAPEGARIELRARGSNGRWSPWARASVQGHDADGASRAPARFGEPVWTGPARELQVRSPAAVEGLTVHLVPAAVISEARSARSVGASPKAAATAGGLALATPVLPAGPGQPEIIARRVWASGRGPATAPAYGDVRMMFVHHSVNANGYSASEVPGMLRAIYEFHRYVRGWDDIGYNFAIDAYGRVWEARAGGIDQAVVGAQAGGYNLESTGVVMLGTFSAALPSAAALRALAHLLAWKLSLHGVAVAGSSLVEVDPADAFYTRFRPGQKVTLPHVAGHRDGCSTDCPGDDLYRHLPVVRRQVRELAGGQLSLSLDTVAVPRHTPARYLQIATSVIPFGQSVTLRGRLARQGPTGTPGAGVAAAAIEIEALEMDGRSDDESVTVGASGPLIVTSAEDGTFRTEFAPTRNMLVRALKTSAPAVASPLMAIAVAPVITLAVSATTPLTLTGTVSPHKATLQLDVVPENGTHTPTQQHVFAAQPDGSFRVRPRLKPGRYRVRVSSIADDRHITGESAWRTLRV